jgi:hypothetical protein
MGILGGWIKRWKIFKSRLGENTDFEDDWIL